MKITRLRSFRTLPSTTSQLALINYKVHLVSIHKKFLAMCGRILFSIYTTTPSSIATSQRRRDIVGRNLFSVLSILPPHRKQGMLTAEASGLRKSSPGGYLVRSPVASSFFASSHVSVKCSFFHLQSYRGLRNPPLWSVDFITLLKFLRKRCVFLPPSLPRIFIPAKPSRTETRPSLGYLTNDFWLNSVQPCF